MAIEEKRLEEILKLVGQLSEDQRLILISKLSSQMMKKSDKQTRSWSDMAGYGAEIWGGTDAQEYVRQERESWDQ